MISKAVYILLLIFVGLLVLTTTITLAVWWEGGENTLIAIFTAPAIFLCILIVAALGYILWRIKKVGDPLPTKRKFFFTLLWIIVLVPSAWFIVLWILHILGNVL